VSSVLNGLKEKIGKPNGAVTVPLTNLGETNGNNR